MKINEHICARKCSTRLFKQRQDVNKSSVIDTLLFAATHKANLLTKQNAHMASAHTAQVLVDMIGMDSLR